MENLNLVELLRDCQTGMELDCTVFDNITFDYVNTEQNRIYCKIDNRDTVWFTAKGCINLAPSAKCVIYPKGKTTWEGFHKPFKDGDVVTWKDRGSLVAFIYKERKDVAVVKHHFALYTGSLGTVTTGEISLVESEIVFATEEEKQKLFDAIKANGYKWNTETKTLELLIKPIFEVGNKIEKCGYRFTIAEVKDDYYLTKCGNKIPIDNQDDFSLVPNKFDITTLKAFDKVLYRMHHNDTWLAGFYNVCINNKFFVIGSGVVPYYIPYENNEHLLGTTNDCDDFYKTWENNN